MMLALSQLPLSLVLTLLAAAKVSAAPSINVGLQAAFPAGPYLLELLETAAGENATSYFPLLDRVASGYFESPATDEALYNKFLELLRTDGHITNDEALSTFKLALSTRSAAPRVEAHYQYYETAVEAHLPEDSQAVCEQWVEWRGKGYCSPNLDTEWATKLDSARTLPFDRTVGSGPVAVLYADPSSPGFGAFHSALSQKARSGKLSYKLRYRRSAGASQKALPINGYGVELALKRTDYIVIDDREAGDDNAQKPLGTEVMLDNEDEVADLKPLSTSELSSLGFKAASFIMQSSDKLDALVKLTQDFPKFSTSIAAHDVSEDFAAEHEANRLSTMSNGANMMWMNGLQLTERQVQPLTLVDMLRQERKIIDGVKALGLSGKEAISLLSHSELASASSEGQVRRFDWRDEKEEGRAIIWLNDIEKDERYEQFPVSLMSLMQRMYPGQLPQIRRNIFHLVVPVDLTKPEDVAAISNLASFVKRLLPIRFGLVPIVSSEDNVKQTKLVYHLYEGYGLETFTTYLQTCLKDETLAKPDQELFDQLVTDNKPLPEFASATFDEILQSEDKEAQIELSRQWIKRLNANTTVPTAFINGIPVIRDSEWLQTMGMQLSQDLQEIQQAIYTQKVKENDSVVDHLLVNAASGRNSYIFPEDDKDLRILNIDKLYSEHNELLSQIPIIEPSSDVPREKWVALTLVADLTSISGSTLLMAALNFRRESPGVRLDVVHNPKQTSSAVHVNASLREQGILDDNDEEEEEASCDKNKEDSVFPVEAKPSKPAEPEIDEDRFTASLSSFLSATGIKPGSTVILLNGRVVGPITAEVPFEKDDFHLLKEFELASRILPVYKAVEDLKLAEKLSSPLAAAKLTSLIALSSASDLPQGIFESAPTTRISTFTEWESKYSAIEVGNIETASIQLIGLINPVSELSQRWAAVFKVLSELDGVYVKIYLNPREKISELPVKRFYRYVLESQPSFDQSGKVRALKANFKALPSQALLTAGMDIPPAWLVAPKVSLHDLDNLKLDTIKGDVEATYELEHVLIEGHSREGKGSKPPRGAQVVLRTEKDPHFADTIIMANLGYFQFKANPGVYSIQLKEGRTSDVYTIESVGAQGYASVAGDEGTEVVLMDFQGTTLYPRLQRKPGQEDVDVLETTVEAEDKEDGGLLSQGLKLAEGLLGGTKKTPSASDVEHAEINIFSVASGHLYERMLNIMMVSVMKNTKHTVKFWFIEQFLSPSFKDFIPHLAAEYGFKYEMVTFKWPHWLRAQKEKQREIWGYKILFLDVLFPLSLDKVIFVDADQIVRTDLIDLINHPLEGRPYGFTPMCDSRTEMEGFRFWKQGYWANYLKGLPYHISALYVVDLGRFRELAAGDRLRQTYHSLSSDPNSLANLDQDLPNHMQFQIPIHSLPQEWLWCETWCSDESLSQARTIDLCNNPLTKEPKLDRARRQVPEWNVYDDEIAAVDRKRRGATGASEQQEAQQGEAQSVEKNPKSRKMEDPPKASGDVHDKDEL